MQYGPHASDLGYYNLRYLVVSTKYYFNQGGKAIILTRNLSSYLQITMSVLFPYKVKGKKMQQI